VSFSSAVSASPQLLTFGFFFGQQPQQHLARSFVDWGLKLLLEELDVLIVDKTLHVPLLPAPAWMTLRFSMTWEMQAIYSEVSKPTRIGHSIRHKVQ